MTALLLIHDVPCRIPTQMGADIIRRALTYPLKLIAHNAGVNGSVVMQKVIDGTAAGQVRGLTGTWVNRAG